MGSKNRNRHQDNGNVATVDRDESIVVDANVSLVPAAVQTVQVDETGAQEAIAAAQAAETIRQDKANDEAAVHLKAILKLCKRGNLDHANNFLAAGEHSDQYIHLRMAVGQSREDAVRIVEGDLLKICIESIDVNRMIACYWAYTLLADGGEPLPYGVYRDVWSRTMERVNKGKDETWQLLSGLEERCKATYADCIRDNVARDGQYDKVAALLKDYAVMQKTAKDHAAKLAEAEAEAKRQVFMEEQRVLASAQQQKADAEEKARQAGIDQQNAKDSEAKRIADENAKQAQADLADAKKTVDEQAGKVQDTEIEAAQAGKVATVAGKEATAAHKAVVKANGRILAATVEPAATKVENLIKIAQKGAVKDVAGMAVELITGGDAPDDVLIEVLRQLDGHKQLCKNSHRIIHAALERLAFLEQHKNDKDVA